MGECKQPKGHDFVYKVEKGDTLWKIAERHNTTIELLMEVRLLCRNYRHIFCSTTAFAISCCSQVISLVPPTIVSNLNNKNDDRNLLSFHFRDPFLILSSAMVFLFCAINICRQIISQTHTTLLKDKRSGSQGHTKSKR